MIAHEHLFFLMRVIHSLVHHSFNILQPSFLVSMMAYKPENLRLTREKKRFLGKKFHLLLLLMDFWNSPFK